MQYAIYITNKFIFLFRSPNLGQQYEWYLQPVTDFAYGLFPTSLYETHPLELYINNPIQANQQQFASGSNPNFHYSSLNNVKNNKQIIQNDTNNSKPQNLKTSKRTTQNQTLNTVTSRPVQQIILSDIINSNESKQSEKLVNFNNVLKENSAKAAPYRAHPLFHYIKYNNTIDFDKIISFRNNNATVSDTITLILKPAAKAVAGQEGKAIANPLARAVLRQGTNVDILFEPDAVAIAGPGGTAHAESDLEIHYEDYEPVNKL
ncbi:protein of unknown function (DUF4774) [Popillia japonica]|uniref:DUF4774 domain-containing protein n=1 Tax=Popillia japonica TaxID=7064 RepID=A0AAW1JYP4_POPJA